jgi:hypothetical protein
MRQPRTLRRWRRRSWRRRPTNAVAMRRPCTLRRWRRRSWRSRPTNAVAMRRPRMLRRWRQRCWPTSEVARNWLCAQRCSPRRPWPSRLLYPPAPHRMRVRFCLIWGGAFCRLCHCLHHCLPPAVRSKWYADASDLAVALDAATVLARPVLLTRLFPPTLNQRGGGLQRRFRQYRPCWRVRFLFLARNWQGQALLLAR